MKLKFTDKELDALSRDRTKRIKIWDSHTEGLGLVIGAKASTWVLNAKRADGKWRQENLGVRDEMTLPEARKKATELLGKVAGDQATPGDKRRLSSTSITLRDAVASKVTNMQMLKKRPSSIDSLQDELLGPHMTDWLDRPIRAIAALECRARHLKIAETSKHSANRIMASFRTVWNHIAEEAVLQGEDEWPVSPTRAVLWFRKTQENYRQRRAEPLMWTDLPAWYARIQKANKVLFNLIALLTGLRRTDVATLRWDHMNLTREPITIQVWDVSKGAWKARELPAQFVFLPSPKGGPVKAFGIPLPQFLVDMLLREKERVTCPWMNHFAYARLPVGMTAREKDGGWVFPGVKALSGPCTWCQETGQGQHVAGKTCHISDARQCDNDLPSSHRLRDTFATATPEVGMPEPIVKALLNHDKGDVTAKYRNLNPELLREWQEKQCTFLLAAIRGEQQRHLRLVAA